MNDEQNYSHADDQSITGTPNDASQTQDSPDDNDVSSSTNTDDDSQKPKRPKITWI